MATTPHFELPPTRFETSCEGKERHATEGGASAALKFYQERGSLRTGSGLQPYKCDFCPFWHLGHANALRAPRTISG